MNNNPFQNPFMTSPNGSFKVRLTHFVHSSSWLNRLIVINVTVFLLMLIFGGLTNLLGFLFQFNAVNFRTETLNLFSCPTNLNTLLHQPWSIFTSLFMHSGFWHIFFNMVMLYIIGRIFLNFLTEKQLLSTYIFGGIFGNIIYILSYNIFPVFASVIPYSYAVGASGSIMAIMATITLRQPNYPMYLMLFGKIKLVTLTLIFVLIDILSIPKGNAGGHLAHLGGVIYGLLYGLVLNAMDEHKIQWPHFNRPKKQRIKKKVKYYVSTESGRPLTDEEYNARKVAEQNRVDDILDKISKSGYDALSKEEKEFLFKYSKK